MPSLRAGFDDRRETCTCGNPAPPMHGLCSGLVILSIASPRTFSDTHYTFDVRLADGHRIGSRCTASTTTSVGANKPWTSSKPPPGTRLDSRIITNFTRRDVLVWAVTGHVQIRVTKELFIGPNGTVSGLFIGPASDPPTVTLTSPANGDQLHAPATVALNATATTPTGTVSKVEFYQGSTKLGEDLTRPDSFSWTNVPAGAYVLTARATHEWRRDWGFGAGATPRGRGTATASFVRTDTTTKGNWRTAYGGEVSRWSEIPLATRHTRRWSPQATSRMSGTLPRPTSARCNARSEAAVSPQPGWPTTRSTST